MKIIKTLESIHALRFHLDEGTIRPLTQSGAGWLLLSTLSDDKIDNIVRRANIATPNNQRVKLNVMMDRIAQIREKGYAVAEDIPILGGRTLCVLLPATIQGQSAALCIGGVAERFRQNHDRYLNALQAAARSAKTPDSFDIPVNIDI